MCENLCLVTTVRNLIRADGVVEGELLVFVDQGVV